MPTCRPLLDVIATIPDVRDRRGKRHPLAGVLALACAATLCGVRGYSAVAEWGHTYREVDPALLRSLGLGRHGPPSSATIHRIFRRIDVGVLEWALGHWAQEVPAAVPAAEGQLEGVAVDGKTLRGTRTDAVPGLHLLAAVSHRLGLTLGQIPVGEKTNEIPLAHTLLAGLLLEGRVLTMDALLTQRAIARDIVAQGGDYPMVAKDNQPARRADIALLFAAPGDDAAARGLRCPSLSTGQGEGAVGGGEHLAEVSADAQLSQPTGPATQHRVVDARMGRRSRGRRPPDGAQSHRGAEHRQRPRQPRERDERAEGAGRPTSIWPYSQR